MIAARRVGGVGDLFVADDTWRHVAVTRDDAGVLALYVGNEASYGTVTRSSVPSNWSTVVRLDAAGPVVMTGTFSKAKSTRASNGPKTTSCRKAR